MLVDVLVGVGAFVGVGVLVGVGVAVGPPTTVTLVSASQVAFTPLESTVIRVVIVEEPGAMAFILV